MAMSKRTLVFIKTLDFLQPVPQLIWKKRFQAALHKQALLPSGQGDGQNASTCPLRGTSVLQISRVIAIQSNLLSTGSAPTGTN